MDSISLGAVLLAIASGAAGGLGGQLWEGVSELVRRPIHRNNRADTTIQLSNEEDELVALKQGQGGEARATALAIALLSRAAEDAMFAKDLERWSTRANRAIADAGTVSNTISGGKQQGPVIQGRDFSNLTFGGTAAKDPLQSTPQS